MGRLPGTSPARLATSSSSLCQVEEEREETLKAIQLGLDDMYAGRTVDAFEFVERMRQKFQSAGKP